MRAGAICSGATPTLEVEEEEALIASQLRWWEEMEAGIRAKLQENDQKAELAYQKRGDLADFDGRFAYKPGDLVLMRQKIPGKLHLRSMGPFKFLSYAGERKVVANLLTAAGKTIQSAVGNLVPCRGEIDFYLSPPANLPNKRPRLVISDSESDVDMD